MFNGGRIKVPPGKHRRPSHRAGPPRKLGVGAREWAARMAARSLRARCGSVSRRLAGYGGRARGRGHAPGGLGCPLGGRPLDPARDSVWAGGNACRPCRGRSPCGFRKEPASRMARRFPRRWQRAGRQTHGSSSSPHDEDARRRPWERNRGRSAHRWRDAWPRTRHGGFADAGPAAKKAFVEGCWVPERGGQAREAAMPGVRLRWEAADVLFSWWRCPPLSAPLFAESKPPHNRQAVTTIWWGVARNEVPPRCPAQRFVEGVSTRRFCHPLTAR